MQGYVNYNKYGIYYSVYADVYTQNSGVVDLTIDLEPVYYHVRCGNTVGPYNIYGYGAGNLTNQKKFQSYQGSGPLNGLHFRARYHGKVTLPTGLTYTKDSDWIQIWVN